MKREKEIKKLCVAFAEYINTSEQKVIDSSLINTDIYKLVNDFADYYLYKRDSYIINKYWVARCLAAEKIITENINDEEPSDYQKELLDIWTGLKLSEPKRKIISYKKYEGIDNVLPLQEGYVKDRRYELESDILQGKSDNLLKSLSFDEFLKFTEFIHLHHNYGFINEQYLRDSCLYIRWIDFYYDNSNSSIWQLKIESVNGIITFSVNPFNKKYSYNGGRRLCNYQTLFDWVMAYLDGSWRIDSLNDEDKDYMYIDYTERPR